MLKMPSELLRLCICHLLTWFSIIAEAVFFTDFMGQVIYHGDPIVRESDTFMFLAQLFHLFSVISDYDIFLRLLPILLCWKIITKEFRWDAGDWLYMP